MGILKKLCALVLCGAVAMGSALYAAPGAVVEDGRVLMGVRAVFEALGFEVGWDGDAEQVMLVREQDIIVLTIGSGEFTANGVPHSLLEPARVVSGATIAPIRPLLAAAGYHLGPNNEILPQFVLGIDAHQSQAATVDEFLPVFGAQLARYNQNAHWLWPNNSITDQSAVLEDFDTGRLWFFEPDGTFSTMSPEEAEAMGIRLDSGEYFTPVIGEDGGLLLIHLGISRAKLLDVEGISRVIHLGTYDAILWLTHEAFHGPEQNKWAMVPIEEMANMERNAYLEKTEARLARNLLQRQLMTALANPGDTRLILDALATYSRWKTDFEQDFLNARQTDRFEGTAWYFEVVSGLVAGYPDLINNWDDIFHAFTIIATYPHFIEIGVVSESYVAGGLAAAILSTIDLGWKEALMADALATPLSLLYDKFAGHELPAPKSLAPDEIARVMESINQERLRLAEAARMGLLLFAGLLDIAEDPNDAAIIIIMLEDAIANLLISIEGLPEELAESITNTINEVKAILAALNE